MKRLVFTTLVISGLAAPVLAAPPEPVGVSPQGAATTNLVLMPQELIDGARNFIRNPVTAGAVDLWVSLTQCEAANAPDASPGAVKGCEPVAAGMAQYRAKMAPAPTPKSADTPAATKPLEK